MWPQLPVALSLLLIVSAISQTTCTKIRTEDYLNENESVTTDETDRNEATTKTDDNAESTPQTESDYESQTATITRDKEEITPKVYTDTMNMTPFTINSRSRNKRRIHFGKIRKCWGSPIYINESKKVHLCNPKPTTVSPRKFLRVHTTDSSESSDEETTVKGSRKNQDIDNLFDKFFKSILDANVHDTVRSTRPTYSETVPERDVFVHTFSPITNKPIPLDDEILVNKTQQLFKEIYDYENLFTTKATKGTQPVSHESIAGLDDNVLRPGKTVDENLADHLFDEINDSDPDFLEDKSFKEIYPVTQQKVNNKTGEHVLFHEIEKDADETDPDEKSAFEGNKYDDELFETTSQETIPPFDLIQTTITSTVKEELVTPVVFPDEVDDDGDETPLKRTTRKGEALTEAPIDKNKTSAPSKGEEDDDDEDADKDDTYIDPNQKPVKPDEEDNDNKVFVSSFTKLPLFDSGTDTDTKQNDEDTDDESKITEDEYHVPREKAMHFDTRPSAVRNYLAQLTTINPRFLTTTERIHEPPKRPIKVPTYEDGKPIGRSRLVHYQRGKKPVSYLDLITGKDDYKKYYYDKDGVPRLKKYQNRFLSPIENRPDDRHQTKYSKPALRTRPDDIYREYKYEQKPEKKFNQYAVLPKMQMKKKPTTKTHKTPPTVLPLQKKTTIPLQVLNQKIKPGKKITTTTKTPKHSTKKTTTTIKHIVHAAVKVQPNKPKPKIENRTRILPVKKATTMGKTLEVPPNTKPAKSAHTTTTTNVHTAHTSSKDMLKIIPKLPKPQSIVETILNELLNKTKLLNETTMNIARTHTKSNATIEKKTVAIFKNLIKTILKVLADKSAITNKTWYNVTHPGGRFSNRTGVSLDLDDDGERILPLSIQEPDSNVGSLFDKTFLRNTYKDNVTIVNTTIPILPIQASHERDLHPPYIDDDSEETFENEPIFSDPEVYNDIPKNLVETVLNIVLDKNLYGKDTSNKTYPYKDENISKSSLMYKSIVETVLNTYLNNKTQIEKLINTTQNLDLTSTEEDTKTIEKKLFVNETSIDTRPYKKITKEKIRISLPTRPTTSSSKSIAISILNKYLASNATSINKNTSITILTKTTPIPLTKIDFPSIGVKVTEPTKEETFKKTGVSATTLKVLPITDSFVKGPPDVVSLSETELSSTISSTDEKALIKNTKSMESTPEILRMIENKIEVTTKHIPEHENAQKVEPKAGTDNEENSLIVIDMNKSKTPGRAFDTPVKQYENSSEVTAIIDVSKNLAIPESALNKTVDATMILNVLPADEESTDSVFETTVPTREVLVDGTTDTTYIPYTGDTEVSTLSTENAEIFTSTSEVTSTTEHKPIFNAAKITEVPKKAVTTTETALRRITVNKTLKPSEGKKKAELILNTMLSKDAYITRNITNAISLNKTISKKPTDKIHTSKTKLDKVVSVNNKTLPIYDTLLINETWHQVPTHATMYLKKTLPPQTNESMTIKTILNKTELEAEPYIKIYVISSTKKPKVQTVDKKLHKSVDSENNLTLPRIPSQRGKTLILRTKLNSDEISKAVILPKTTKSTIIRNKPSEMLTHKILKEAGTDRKSTMPLKERGTQKAKESKVVKKPITKAKPTVKTLPYISKYIPKALTTKTSITRRTKGSKMISTTLKRKKTLAPVKNATVKASKSDSIKANKQKTKLLLFTTLPTTTSKKTSATRAGTTRSTVGIIRRKPTAKSTTKTATKVTQKRTKATQKTTLPGLHIQQKSKSIHSTKATKTNLIKDAAKKQTAVAVHKTSKKPKTVTSHTHPTLKTTLPTLTKSTHTSLQTTAITKSKSTATYPSTKSPPHKQRKLKLKTSTQSIQTLPSVPKYKLLGNENTSKRPFRDDVHLAEDYDVYEDNPPMPDGTTPENMIDKILRINATRWQGPRNEKNEDEYYEDEEEEATSTKPTVPYKLPKKLYGTYLWSTPKSAESLSNVTTTTSIPSVGGTDDLIQSTSSYLTQKFYEYDKSLPPVSLNTNLSYTNATAFKKISSTQPTLLTSLKHEEEIPINVLPLIPTLPPPKDDQPVHVIGLSKIPTKDVIPTPPVIISRTLKIPAPQSSTAQPFWARISTKAKPVKPAIPSTERPTTTMSPTITLVAVESYDPTSFKTTPKISLFPVSTVKTQTTLAKTTTEKRSDEEKSLHPIEKKETTVPVEITSAQDTFDKPKPSHEEKLSKLLLKYGEIFSSVTKPVISPTKETLTPSTTQVSTFPTDSVSTMIIEKQINELLNKTSFLQFITAPISEVVPTLEVTTRETWLETGRHEEVTEEILETDAPKENAADVYTKGGLQKPTMSSYDYEALAEIEKVPPAEPSRETIYSTVESISSTKEATSEPPISTREVTPVDSNLMLDFEVDTPPISAKTTLGATFPTPDLLIDKPILANDTLTTRILPAKSPTKATKLASKDKVKNGTIPMNVTVIAIGSLPISNGSKADNKKYAYTILNDNLDTANEKISPPSPTEEYVRILANHTYPNITSFISKFNFNKTLLENYLYKLLSENETCVNKTNSVDDVHLNITLAIDRKHLNKTIFTNDTLKIIGDKKSEHAKPSIFDTTPETDDDGKLNDMDLKKLAIAIYLNRTMPVPHVYPVITPLPDFMDVVDDVDDGAVYSDMAAPESETDDILKPVISAAEPMPTLHIVDPITTKATSVDKSTITNIEEANEKAVPKETDSYKEEMDRLSEGIDTKVVEKKSSTAQIDYTTPPKNLTTLSDIYTKIAFPTIKSRVRPLSISETYWKHLLESEINKRKQVPIVQIHPTQSIMTFAKNQSTKDERERRTEYPHLWKIIRPTPNVHISGFAPSTERTSVKEEPVKYKIPIEAMPNFIPEEQKPVAKVSQAPDLTPNLPKPETIKPDMQTSETLPELPPNDLVLYPEPGTSEAYMPTAKTYMEEKESQFFIKTTTESHYPREPIDPSKIRYEKSKRIHIDTCGIDNYPSSGGEEGTQRIEKYPWLGVLIYPRGKQRLVTTVVLVTVQLVVASALDIEKLPKKDLRTCARVVLGANCTGPRIRVLNYNYHPDFRAGTASAIALIQINTNFLVHQLRPICGPPKRFVDPQFFAMVMPNDCRSSKITLYAMDYVPTDTCKEYYKHAGLDVDKMWPKHTACGRSRWGGQCTWRTGTLLVVRQEYRWHLVGFGVRGPGCEAPARFVDFAMYHAWVTTTVARIGQPAITRIAPNHLILRRSINELQKFGPCDSSEVSTEIFTDTTTLTPPPENHLVGMARYNLTILANVDYHCVVFSAKNIRGMEHDPPRLELRRYCRGPPKFCFTGPGLIQIDFYVTIYFFYPVEYKVAAYGQLAKVAKPKLLTKYVNKRYKYPAIPYWQTGEADKAKNSTNSTLRSFKSRRTFLENFRNSNTYKYHRRMGKLSRFKAREQRRIETLRRITDERRREEIEQERLNNITYLESSAEFI